MPAARQAGSYAVPALTFTRPLPSAFITQASPSDRKTNCAASGDQSTACSASPLEDRFV